MTASKNGKAVQCSGTWLHLHNFLGVETLAALKISIELLRLPQIASPK